MALPICKMEIVTFHLPANPFYNSSLQQTRG